MVLRDIIKPDHTNSSYDVYDLGDQQLLVAHDQLWLARQRLPDLIPNKGKVVAQLAAFWYELFEGFLESSFISADLRDLPDVFQPYQDEVNGRFLLLSKADQFSTKAQVIGYLTAPMLPEYQQGGTVGGVEVESDLILNSRLRQAIYVPYLSGTLADAAWQEKLCISDTRAYQQLDLMQTVELFGNRDAMIIASTALEFYSVIEGLARSRGVILAEIDMQFGKADEQVVIVSVPAPEDSLIWLADSYEAGKENGQFVFQAVIDWFANHWDGSSELPRLPAELVELTARCYVDVYEQITGEELVG